MALLFGFTVILFLVIVETKWAKSMLLGLTVNESYNRLAVDCNEPVTMTLDIINRNPRLPAFVQSTDLLPGEATILESDEWKRVHCRVLSKSTFVNRSFYLKASHKHTMSMQFTFNRRGQYMIGRRIISAGDMFGISDEGREHYAERKVVVFPKRSDDVQMIKVLGNFLGDISVQRFIMEDPILTVGFDDYTGHEPMKDISWMRTASAGRMMVRKYDHTVDQTVRIIMNVEAPDSGVLENVFSTVRTVCEQLETRKIPYGIVTNGRMEDPYGTYDSLPEGLGENHLRKVLYGLGCSDNTRFISFGSLVAKVLLNRKDRESYIVVTPKLDTEGLQSVAALERAQDGRVCVLECGKEADKTA